MPDGYLLVVEGAAARSLIVPVPFIALLAIAGVGAVWIGVLLADGLRATLAASLSRHQRRREARPLALEVIERRQVEEGLIIVRLASAVGERLPRFRPGQHVAVLVPNRPDALVQRRCYSLAAWETRPRWYELCIKREPGGRVSPRLHDELHPGRRIEVLPPRGGCFVGTSGAREIVLVAGGVGIAPLRAIVQWATRRVRSRSVTPRVVLFHAARTQRSLCYLDEFRQLAKVQPGFRFHPIVSRPQGPWPGLVGRLSAKRLLEAVANPKQAQFYLCGPPTMLASLAAGLRIQGVSESQIHCERFLAGERRNDGGSFRIELDGGQSLWFRGQRTLLDALTDHRVAIPSECRTGECGECRVRLVSGEVRTLLSSTARCRHDEILPCCCVPTSDLQLEFLGI